MAVLSDILALLDRWDEWRRIREAPARIDALERRLAQLEATPRGDCRKCGQGNMLRSGTVFMRAGRAVQKFRCAEPTCGNVEERPA